MNNSTEINNSNKELVAFQEFLKKIECQLRLAILGRRTYAKNVVSQNKQRIEQTKAVVVALALLRRANRLCFRLFRMWPHHGIRRFKCSEDGKSYTLVLCGNWQDSSPLPKIIDLSVYWNWIFFVHSYHALILK